MQDLKPYSTFPTNTKEEDLRKRISELKAQLKEEELKRKVLNEEIDSSFDVMRKENEKYESMHEALLDDIHILKQELKFELDDKETNTPTENTEQTEPSEEKITDLKKLYHRISSLCHPDKTDDPKLHEIFLEAKKAYDNKNIEQLQYIYSMLMTDEDIDLSIMRKTDNGLNTLETAIEVLLKKIIEEKQEYEKVVHSLGYKIHRRLHSPLIPKQMRARHEYSELLFRKIETAAEEKQKLLKVKEAIGEKSG